jgi:hypothetical protein
MWAALNAIDAKAITLAAIDQQAKNHIRKIADLTKLVQSIDTAKAA